MIVVAVVKSPLQLHCTLARVSSTVNITAESPTVRTADGAYITVLYKAAGKREEGCVAGTRRVIKRAYITSGQQQQKV